MVESLCLPPFAKSREGRGTPCAVCHRKAGPPAPIPEMRVHFLTALAVSVPLGIITAFLMGIAVRARRNKIVTGEQGLIGEIGIAQTTLAPTGKVFVHGELWDAVSTVPVRAGERIVVRQVDGLTLRVDPVLATKPVMA